MRDLEKLRLDLRAAAQELQDKELQIPRALKKALCENWDRCLSVENNGLMLTTKNGSDFFSDLDLLKAVYASDLTRELIGYREELQRFLDKCGVSAVDAKDLASGTGESNPPLWWDRVSEEIRMELGRN